MWGSTCTFFSARPACTTQPRHTNPTEAKSNAHPLAWSSGEFKRTQKRHQTPQAPKRSNFAFSRLFRLLPLLGAIDLQRFPVLSLRII